MYSKAFHEFLLPAGRYELQELLLALRVEGPGNVVAADALVLEWSALPQRQAPQQVRVVAHGKQESQTAVVQSICGSGEVKYLHKKMKWNTMSTGKKILF